MTSVAVLEQLTLVAPLGLRLRDEVTRTDISDGLSVVVYPAAEPERRFDGMPNASGIFVFSNLPGLRDVERGDAPITPSFPFVLEVRDRKGRYLPWTTTIDLPALGVQTLPLYSSSARVTPDGMGALRAELIDENGGPAAWALIEATAGEQRLMTGIADERGRVMLPLFYPKPGFTLGSPGASRTPITSQSWSVDVTIRYRRRDPIPDVPDLDDILSQPIATASLPTSPPTAWSGGTLRFGRELVPETAGGDVMPALLITPAGSPP